MNQITPEWRRWIAENVMRGAEPVSIINALVQNQMDPTQSMREVREASEHPYVAAGKSLARQLKKRDWVLDCHRVSAELSPDFAQIEHVHRPTREQFLKNYYAAGRPCVIEGALENWKAMTTWTPAALKHQLGDRIVEVQARRNSDPNFELNSDRLKKDMRFGDYIDAIAACGVSNDFYMTANNSGKNFAALRELWDDIDQLPEYLSDRNSNQLGFFWLGPAGTITPLHHDLTNNFMAQVYGRKLVKMVSPAYLPHLYNHHHCYVQVDLENPDYARYPLFRNVKVHEVVLEPGQVLFLPVGWWHHVRGLDISMTMSFTNFQFNNDFHSFYQTYAEI